MALYELTDEEVAIIRASLNNSANHDPYFFKDGSIQSAEGERRSMESAMHKLGMTQKRPFATERTHP